MKGIYILFSGGYDSSYLINKLLMNMKNDNDDKTELNLLSLDASFLGPKSEREKRSRERLLSYWKAKYYNQKINHLEIKIDVTKFSANSYKTGLAQPEFWVSALTSAIDYTRYEEITVLFSYICGDQAVTYKHEIETIVNCTTNLAFCDFHQQPMRMLEKPKVNILFPLCITYKEEIISNLILDDVFIFDNSTTCEGQFEYDFCNNCTACRNLRAVLNNIISDKNTDLKVKQKCEKTLNLFHQEKVITVDKEEEELTSDR